MTSKLSTWFRGLSRGGRIALLVGVGISLFATINAFADNEVVITTKDQTESESIPFEVTYQDDDNLLITETSVLSPGVNGSKEVTYKVTYKNGKESKREAIKQVVKKEPSAQVSKKGTKVVTTEQITEVVPYGTQTINDSSMDKGISKVATTGTNGSKVVTIEITKIKGQEIARKVIKEELTVLPRNQITVVGTKVKSTCDPNYSGACVPIASDVDCGSGSGNGPAYVYGTVRVIGSDIYGLDRDGDGYGCD